MVQADFPEHLSPFLQELHELFASPANRAKARMMVMKWRAEAGPEPLEFLCFERDCTLPETYALLAAIHDEGWGQGLVDPWAGPSRRAAAVHKKVKATHRRYEDFKRGIEYTVLRQSISEISPEQARYLPSYIRTIREDLASLQSQQKSHVVLAKVCPSAERMMPMSPFETAVDEAIALVDGLETRATLIWVSNGSSKQGRWCTLPYLSDEKRREFAALDMRVYLLCPEQMRSALQPNQPHTGLTIEPSGEVRDFAIWKARLEALKGMGAERPDKKPKAKRGRGRPPTVRVDEDTLQLWESGNYATKRALAVDLDVNEGTVTKRIERAEERRRLNKISTE